MRIAFGVFKFFQYGGLQLDMMRIAECAVSRGHQVVVFYNEIEGIVPTREGLEFRLLATKCHSNHGRALDFEKKFKIATEKFDLTFAFNRFGGADYYFAADNCLLKTELSRYPAWLLKLFSRYRTFFALENAVFNRKSKTKIFYIAPAQKIDYQNFYQTPEDRFIFLPPGIDRKFVRPVNAEELRRKKRLELGIGEDELLLIHIGASFYGKGRDLVLLAVAELEKKYHNKLRVLLVGPSNSRKEYCFAHKCGVSEHIIQAGARDDVPELLLAADLMVHPSRNESAGNVLLEGIASGLPVLCSRECGFSNYVEEASGLVLPFGTKKSALVSLLIEALDNLPVIAQKTREYAVNADFYRRSEVAVDFLESDKNNVPK